LVLHIGDAKGSDFEFIGHEYEMDARLRPNWENREAQFETPNRAGCSTLLE
jgi:hypothetical protein